MFYPLAHIGLTAPVGPDLDNDEGDVSVVGHALDMLGYPAGDAARTGRHSGAFSDAVAAFQSDHRLTVDRVLLPGGETQLGLNRRLSGRAAEIAQSRADATATDALRPPLGIPAAPARWPGREPDTLRRPQMPAASWNITATSWPAAAERDAEASDRPLWFRSGLEPKPAPARPAPPLQPPREPAPPSMMDEYARLRRQGYDYRPDPFGRLGQGDWFDENGRKLSETERQWLAADPTPATNPWSWDNLAATQGAPPVANPIFETLPAPADRAGDQSEVEYGYVPTLKEAWVRPRRAPDGEPYHGPLIREDDHKSGLRRDLADAWEWLTHHNPSAAAAKQNQIERTERVIAGYERELARKDLSWVERWALNYARGQALNTLVATEGQFPTTPLEIGFAGLELAGLVRLATGSIRVFRHGNRIFTDRDIVDGKLVGPGRALKENQNPYDPIAMRQLLESMYPNEKILSYTMPEVSHALRNANKQHGKTGIVFNNRGLPIFDDVAVFDTRIPKANFYLDSAGSHSRAATRSLRDALESGKFPKTRFTREQLDAIKAGDSTIPGFRWHHHESPGRMQLVPKELHVETHDLGGMGLRKGR